MPGPSPHFIDTLVDEVLGRVHPVCAAPGQAAAYHTFAREFYATLRRPFAGDFSLRTRRTVTRWFRRGLSGRLLWAIGETLVKQAATGGRR